MLHEYEYVATCSAVAKSAWAGCAWAIEVCRSASTAGPDHRGHNNGIGAARIPDPLD